MILKLWFLNNAPKAMQQYHCQQDLASFPVLYQKLSLIIESRGLVFAYTFSGALVLCSWHLAMWLARLMPFNMAKSFSCDCVVMCQLPSSPLSGLEDTTYQADLLSSMSSSRFLGTSPLLPSLQPWRPQAPGQTSCDNPVTEKWNLTSHRESTL